MGERIPTISRTLIELLEQSDNRTEPIPEGAVITLDLPTEFLVRMELYCKRNPTSLTV